MVKDCYVFVHLIKSFLLPRKPESACRRPAFPAITAATADWKAPPEEQSNFVYLIIQGKKILTSAMENAGKGRFPVNCGRFILKYYNPLQDKVQGVKESFLIFRYFDEMRVEIMTTFIHLGNRIRQMSKIFSPVSSQ